MSNEINISILELLTSKICHDLISPIGAVNNGLEVLEELGEEAGEDVINLIAFSASQASAKLQAYRMAYGAGGADPNIKPEDVYNAIESIITGDNKIKQNWDPHGDLGPEQYPKAYCKMLISCLLLAMDCLPKGGSLSILAGENGQTIIKAEGENAGFRDGIEQVLSMILPASELEPKYIHAHTTAVMAKNYGYEVLILETGPGFVNLGLKLSN